MDKAIGLIEVRGFTAALVAADAAAKVAPVEIFSMEDTRPLGESGAIPVTVVVKLRGEVSAVMEAVAAGKKAARKICGDGILAHVIPRPSGQLDEIVKRTTVGPQ
ncbi:MAG TPA: BMC domain-containing protein [Bacilli bacterium]